mgnify:CR=1 FL=1
MHTHDYLRCDLLGRFIFPLPRPVEEADLSNLQQPTLAEDCKANKLVVKASGAPDTAEDGKAGNGVFTGHAIAKGASVCYLWGEVVQRSPKSARYRKWEALPNVYMVELRAEQLKRWAIKPAPGCVANFIQSCEYNQEGVDQNVEFHERNVWSLDLTTRHRLLTVRHST